MKNFNIIYLFLFVSMGVIVSSCGENHEDNEITITIDEPLDGDVIASINCGNVKIHIDVEASEENHEVEIVLHPEGDVDNKIIDYDLHDHDLVISFEQEVDLCSFAAGTCFHLEVEACVDHDCEEKATAVVEFCLE